MKLLSVGLSADLDVEDCDKAGGVLPDIRGKNIRIRAGDLKKADILR